jgi:hypothetical protein
MAQLKKVTSKPVKYVINTRHHGDRSGGNAKMQKMSVQIVASRQARENMVNANQPGLPDVVFDHQSEVFLGGPRRDPPLRVGTPEERERDSGMMPNGFSINVNTRFRGEGGQYQTDPGAAFGLTSSNRKNSLANGKAARTKTMNTSTCCPTSDVQARLRTLRSTLALIIILSLLRRVRLDGLLRAWAENKGQHSRVVLRYVRMRRNW